MPGEYIWVIEGKYAGEWGQVTEAHDLQVKFFSEIWKWEYTALVYDVQISKEAPNMNISHWSSEYWPFMRVKLIDRIGVGILLEVEKETA